MNRTSWTGVFPAITTPFRADGSVDYDLLGRHAAWMVDHGCRGMIPLGSLGESATLTFEEKVRVLETVVEAVGSRVPVASGISGMSTAECVRLAREAERVGCEGMMVLPPYVYLGDEVEIETHLSAIIEATGLGCMLYNNPIAYTTDLKPAQIERLCRYENVHAVKESSGDIRRLTQIRARIGDRLALFVGIDDVIVESIAVGATGWVAGLVNAFPAESVRLYDLAMAGRAEEARALYEWFLPLLDFDLGPKFVQKIKIAQAAMGWGTTAVRAPRLELSAAERAEVDEVLQQRLATPVVASISV
jgi:4-hydroxy-tetrahydrodipicolinate synthase